MVYHFDKLLLFYEKYISIISKNHIFKSRSLFTLEILSLNSNSKINFNQIHLIQKLNQLQSLTVEGILDNTIKNKSKIFINLD